MDINISAKFTSPNSRIDSKEATSICKTYPQAPKKFIEQIGIETFLDGLLDTEMKQALRLGRHTTITDAQIAALEFKAATEVSRSYKPRVRQVKFDECQLLKGTS
ncbi:hypothetical protein NQ318_000311 [Aromia moschata]|uniref:Uncharacterized protein n=1 Tax=Aromia moschata TaxID=1265417 RepID=A0AAV8YUW5_9CUCU|nr:hypothetical protein NQ318_000311 [Aromia moschata]